MGIPDRPASVLFPSASGPDLERLSGPAIRAFFNLADAWNLTTEEQRALLGGVSRSTFHRWKKDREALLSLDQLERISHLLGIYKNLQILLPTSGNDWVRQPNDNPLFAGRPAIDLMVQGGITWLHRVRAFLDAQRGGWA
jgi:hypothetical protein